jgi:AraC-like DNA-binding protein
MQYIRQGHRPLGEVAFLLGFSEPGNFTRAFRRWTGLAPKEFRAQA